MSYSQTEEIQYCTNCGSVNKKSDVVCDECGKKIVILHRPFWDYVKKHTKTGVKEKMKSDLFGALKDFLFKHLYGTIVSFLIAATVTTAAVTATPYIKRVSEFPKQASPEQTVSVQTATPHNVELNDKIQNNLRYGVMIYDAVLTETLRTRKEFYSWDEADKYTDASECFAENNIEGYSWQGRHDMYTNPLDVGFDIQSGRVYHGDEPMPTQYHDWVESTIVTGADVTSELGKELYKNGYDVVEGDYYMIMSYNLFEYDYDAPPPLDKKPLRLLKYRVLLTKKPEGNRWYIAEDILEERKGV